MAGGLLLVLLQAAWVDPPAAEPDYVYITTYDYSLGGHNCFWDEALQENVCSHTALMIPTDVGLYGWTAACPYEWVTYGWTTIVSIYGIEFWCIDNFGSAVDQQPRYIDGNLAYRIDLLIYKPATHPWNQKLVPMRFVSTRPGDLSEFEGIRRGMGD